MSQNKECETTTIVFIISTLTTTCDTYILCEQSQQYLTTSAMFYLGDYLYIN